MARGGTKPLTFIPSAYCHFLYLIYLGLHFMKLKLLNLQLRHEDVSFSYLNIFRFPVGLCVAECQLFTLCGVPLYGLYASCVPHEPWAKGKSNLCQLSDQYIISSTMGLPQYVRPIPRLTDFKLNLHKMQKMHRVKLVKSSSFNLTEIIP